MKHISPPRVSDKRSCTELVDIQFIECYFGYTVARLQIQIKRFCINKYIEHCLDSFFLLCSVHMKWDPKSTNLQWNLLEIYHSWRWHFRYIVYCFERSFETIRTSYFSRNKTLRRYNKIIGAVWSLFWLL